MLRVVLVPTSSSIYHLTCSQFTNWNVLMKLASRNQSMAFMLLIWIVIISLFTLIHSQKLRVWYSCFRSSIHLHFFISWSASPSSSPPNSFLWSYVSFPHSAISPHCSLSHTYPTILLSLLATSLSLARGWFRYDLETRNACGNNDELTFIEAFFVEV